jgi:hypothetical protein
MAYIIALMMGTVSTSETSVSFYETTQRNTPEDCLRTRLRESLELSEVILCFLVHVICKFIIVSEVCLFALYRYVELN